MRGMEGFQDLGGDEDGAMAGEERYGRYCLAPDGHRQGLGPWIV